VTGAIQRSLGGVRREHRTFRTQLADLQRLASQPATPGPAHSQLERALGRFLDVWGPRLTAHLDTEERLVTPGVLKALPVETWTRDTFRRERETFDALLDLLREGRGWLERHEAGAEREVAAALDDLSSLWGRHVRRVDVIGPLLVNPEGSSRA
jgi:hypothetical protein